jgi:hypothetical protein
LTHKLESAWFQPLNLESDRLVSKFAFKFNLNLRRYNVARRNELARTVGGLYKLEVS